MYHIINRSNRVLNLNVLGQSIQILPNDFHKFAESFRLQEIIHAVKNFKSSVKEFPFLVDIKSDGVMEVYEYDPDKSLEKLAKEIVLKVKVVTGEAKKESPVVENTELEVDDNPIEDTEVQEEEESFSFEVLDLDNVHDFLSDLTREDRINSLKSQLKFNLESDAVLDEYKLNLVKKVADELCISYSARSGYISIYKNILKQI